MDEDLKNVLTYFFGTILGVGTLITTISKFTKDLNFIIIYTTLTIIFVWLVYIQVKIYRLKEGKK